jgi:hypothetical protein
MAADQPSASPRITPARHHRIHGLRPLFAAFGKAGVEEAHDRDVQAVEPDQSLLAEVAVVMPGVPMRP